MTTRAVNSYGLPTLASTNAITVTNGSNLYIAGGAGERDEYDADQQLRGIHRRWRKPSMCAATNSYVHLYVNCARTGTATNNYGAVFSGGQCRDRG